MAFADVLNTIETHAQTAANALSNPIKDVKIGYPKAPQAGGRSVRIFWGGEIDPAHIGARRTLNSEMVGDIVVVIAFWSLSSLSEEQAEVVELEARAFAAGFRSAINGDAQLGGNVTDLDLSDATPEFPVLAGAQYRTVTYELATAYTETTRSP